MGRFQPILRIARATRLSINACSAPPCCIPVRLPDSSPSSTLTPLPRAFPELCAPYSHNTKSQATHILPLFRTYASEATTRHTNFSSLNAADVDYFRSVIGESGVVQDVDALESANQDWIGKYKGSSKILLRPETTAQVSQVLRHCNERQLAVVPQGGNTGLVGGSVPVFDEVSGILVAESGCVLQTLTDFVKDEGYIMPLDLGAKGSCQIGGNVSTNAGGLRMLRYGSLHGSVLGLEVVLANGTVVDLLGTLRKDNTGYDLKQLFIGAEGTLGVITKVCLLTPRDSPSTHVAFLAVTSYDKVKVLTHLTGIRNPLPTISEPFYVLVETSGSNREHDRAKMEGFLESASLDQLIVEGTIAADRTQEREIWSLREGVTESLQKAGAVYKYDLSIPVGELYDLVTIVRKRLDGLATVVAYGHLGDGNLHLNISAPKYDQKILDLIEPFVYEWTAERGGSISAEHGIGYMKPGAIRYSKKPEAIRLMAQVKGLFDPNRILNPYKVLPQDALSPP